MSKLEYRPDVDGLRTVAVLPVVLFHFGVSQFSGGFVGVDVFFVISGYLITRLILNEFDNGHFSFVRFYERRARRLFPAMFVVVTATLIAVQFFLLPAYRAQAAGSAIFAVTSLSNLFFWSQSGYFDSEALTKPLLHTWSLSVEEQFYLVWPAALIFIASRFGRPGVLIALIVGGIASLAASELVMRNDPSTAFYLTPFRIAEFAIGASVLWVERFLTSARWLQELCLTVGLAMIAFAVFTYSESTPFPGLATLLPGLGTGLAMAGGRAPITGLLLRNRLAVAIGLISYSIYLVHWPLAVFFDAYFLREPTPMEQLALIAATLVLAAAMYRFVETPFRRPVPGRRFSPPAFGLTCAMLALVVVVVASVQWSSREEATDEFASMTRDILSVPLGLIGVTPAYGQDLAPLSSDHLAAMSADRSQALRAIDCSKDKLLCGEVAPHKINVLVVGDSHATDGFNMLATAYPEINILLTRSQGCAPFDAPGNDAECTEENVQRAEIINKLAPDMDYILVHVRVTPQRPALLGQYVKDLSALGPRIVVMGSGPVYDRSLPDLYARAASPSDPFPDFTANRDPASFDGDSVIRTAADEAGAVFIDRRPFFCPDDVCSDYTPTKSDLVTFDKHHLSWGAAVALGEYVRQTYPDLFK